MAGPVTTPPSRIVEPVYSVVVVFALSLHCVSTDGVERNMVQNEVLFAKYVADVNS